MNTLVLKGNAKGQIETINRGANPKPTARVSKRPKATNKKEEIAIDLQITPLMQASNKVLLSQCCAEVAYPTQNRTTKNTMSANKLMVKNWLRLAILGSTGSIGRNGVEIALQNKDLVKVELLVASGSNPKLILEQCRLLKPKYVFLKSKSAISALAKCLNEIERKATTVLPIGLLEKTLRQADQRFDITLAAIAGFEGIWPTVELTSRSARIAIANKEAIICGWELIKRVARRSCCEIIPVDSEHNALYQILEAFKNRRHENTGQRGNHNQAKYATKKRSNIGDRSYDKVEKLTITASGGPFLKYPGQLSGVTPQMAIKHPKWNMGEKNSVDSATLVNKGMEIMEACLLFNLPEDKVQEVVHPQAIMHAMVSYNNGAHFAFLSAPDMRIHIANAMGLSEGMNHTGLTKGHLAEMLNGGLEFAELDHQRFPSVRIARKAIRYGHTCMFAYTVANEVAVRAFLRSEIKLIHIFTIIERAVDWLQERGWQKVTSKSKARRLQSQVVNFASSVIKELC